MSFNVDVHVDTKQADTLDMLGRPDRTTAHQLNGTITLTITGKPIQLRSVVATFVGEVVSAFNPAFTATFGISENETLCSVDIPPLVSTTCTYNPGQYTFPFSVQVPGHMAASLVHPLKNDDVRWTYEIRTFVEPMGMFARNRIFRHKIQLRRLIVPPSDQSKSRFTAKRKGEFEVSIHTPRAADIRQDKFVLQMFMHPYTRGYRVREVMAIAMQHEYVLTASKRANLAPDSPLTFAAMITHSVPAGPTLSKFESTRIISLSTKVQNPYSPTDDLATSWGREEPLEIVMNLVPKTCSADDDVGWLRITHSVRLTIEFMDPGVKALIVLAPFRMGHILEHWMVESNNNNNDGVAPPSYGVDQRISTLLDENTSRAQSRARLHMDLYPEREPIQSVPDLLDDTYGLPPMYDSEGEDTVQLSDQEESTTLSHNRDSAEEAGPSSSRSLPRPLDKSLPYTTMYHSYM